jgi:hypothetical protein
MGANPKRFNRTCGIVQKHKTDKRRQKRQDLGTYRINDNNKAIAKRDVNDLKKAKIARRVAEKQGKKDAKKALKDAPKTGMDIEA